MRVAGNPALRASWKKHSGRVLGFFCFDPVFLSREDFSHDRFAFFLKTLQALKAELQELGGDLLVLDGGPDEAFARLFAQLEQARVPGPAGVSFNRDYEPFARERDARLTAWLQKRTEVETARDHLLIEPGELEKGTGGHYTVYTPFARKWFELLKQSGVQARIEAQKEGLRYLEKRARGTAKDPARGKNTEPLFALTWAKLFEPGTPPPDQLDALEKLNSRKVRVPIPEAGSLAAFRALEEFAPKLPRYLGDRDIPIVPGTSKLSIYFKNGSLTVPQAIAWLELQRTGIESKTGQTQYLKELVWREFYYHILWHRPDVEHQAFLPQYRALKWENDERKFEAWKEGRTGYPIVDAAMRELATTGWMHNRARMIVASFLTKDLLIDWRWGEKHFMERLIDGDLAPNNGGWQWAASTGCDPQPYFRIFNPELQSKKFDPDGEYIRLHVPELRGLKGKAIHAPEGSARGYPEPIVDHAVQRDRALRLYKPSH